jgi:hypothetical protein
MLDMKRRAFITLLGGAVSRRVGDVCVSNVGARHARRRAALGAFRDWTGCGVRYIEPIKGKTK